MFDLQWLEPSGSQVVLPVDLLPADFTKNALQHSRYPSRQRARRARALTG